MILSRRLIEYLNKNHPGSARKLYKMMRHMKVPLNFALWYALNILYNVTNKWALDDVRTVVRTATNENGIFSSLPITMGCLQFAVGSIYACTLWLIGWRRPVPYAKEMKTAVESCFSWMRRSDGHSYISLESSGTIRAIPQIAIFHTLGQLCTVLSLSLNSIGFAHVVKAMEPFFSAMASWVCFGKRMDIRVYLALLPVVGGVIMAVSGSDEFSWSPFWFGMGE
jgi:solute carrier family 35 protein E1